MAQHTLWSRIIAHQETRKVYPYEQILFDAKSVCITNRIGAFVNYVLLGWIFILSPNVIGSSFFRVMSDSTPCWAPTTAEIQTWEPRGGGRGFAPSGMGRGSAKWSLPGTRTSLGRSLDPESQIGTGTRPQLRWKRNNFERCSLRLFQNWLKAN